MRIKRRRKRKYEGKYRENPVDKKIIYIWFNFN